MQRVEGPAKQKDARAKAEVQIPAPGGQGEDQGLEPGVTSWVYWQWNWNESWPIKSWWGGRGCLGRSSSACQETLSSAMLSRKVTSHVESVNHEASDFRDRFPGPHRVRWKCKCLDISVIDVTWTSCLSHVSKPSVDAWKQVAFYAIA